MGHFIATLPKKVACIGLHSINMDSKAGNSALNNAALPQKHATLPSKQRNIGE